MDMPKLIAHWPLQQNSADSISENHGQAENVTFVEDEIKGRVCSVAAFNGGNSVITVPDNEVFHFGNRDFSFALWVKVDAPTSGVFGYILSKFDAGQRCGFQLSLAGSASGYNTVSDTRHIHFGIDDGYISSWIDYGMPWPSNAVVPCTIVYEGALYCGIGDADNPKDAAHVFRWAGGLAWEDCGRVGDDLKHISVQAMLEHRGQLLVNAGIYDWERAEGYDYCKGYDPSPTRVYAYEGDMNWRDLGQIGHGVQVSTMASFEGDLYVSLDWKSGGGKCFKYDGSRWVDCGAPGTGYLSCLFPYNGSLYSASHKAELWRYIGGKEWVCVGNQPYGIQQVHSMQDVNGELWVGTWPQGYVMRYEGGEQWAIIGRLGIQSARQCNEVMDLAAHNGKVYAALLPKAQVYRYEADGQWTLLNSLASRPDFEVNDHYSWCRVTSLNSFQGRLIATTGSCVGRAIDVDRDKTLGRVLALQTGTMASHHNDIGDKWTQITGVRKGRELQLFVNGVLSTVSPTPESYSFDLTNPSDLSIGFGVNGFLRGRLSDLHFYDGALDGNDIEQIMLSGDGR